MNLEKTVEQKIIESAADLFLTKGFKSVTMDDLAFEMGMSKKTIYTFFKTKNELVLAATEQIFNSINTGINNIRSLNLNPIEELFTINDFVSEIIFRFYFFSISQIKNTDLFPELEFKNYEVLKAYLNYHIRGIATDKGLKILEKQTF